MADDATPEGEDAPVDELVEVIPQNASAARLFFGLETQWETVAVVIGMRAMLLKTRIVYGSIEVIAAGLKIEVDETVLKQLKVLEAEAALAMAERMAVV